MIPLPAPAKKRPFHFILILLLLILSVLFIGSSHSSSSNKMPTAGTIIGRLIRAFQMDCEERAIQELLDTLETIDPDAAKDWREIALYRKEINAEDTVYSNQVPAGFASDDSVCFVVLGYALQSDGSMMPELLGRLQTALNCAQEYPNAYLLCTGGGTASHNSEVTEADSMKEWLIEHGIAENRIIVENQSLNTAQNALYSMELLDRLCPNTQSIIIVTSNYHIPWGALLFQTACILSHNANTLRVVGHAAYNTNTTLASLCSIQASGIQEIYNHYK